jgi:elongation factor P
VALRRQRQMCIRDRTYTEPGLRGDTATNAMKPATLDVNVEVRVPLFIEVGDKIRIDTSTGHYHDRVKK